MKKTYTRSEVDAMMKAYTDAYEQKDEVRRMKKMSSLLWKARSLSVKLHYWIISFDFVVGMAIWYFTEDFWKALAFLIYAEIYSFCANLRGMGLHVENLTEWIMKKTV